MGLPPTNCIPLATEIISDFHIVLFGTDKQRQCDIYETNNCLCRNRSSGTLSGLFTGFYNFDIQFTDLVTQSIAIETEQLGGPQLIAPCGGQTGRQQRLFHLL